MHTIRKFLTYVLVYSLIVWPLTASRGAAQDPEGSHIQIAEDQALFELVGQVKNSPPAGPGLPPTSVQYGYLSNLSGLDNIFTTSDPTLQNEQTARFTFYNDSVTQRVITHGNLRIINRTGTMTIYFNAYPNGDLTTPNPDSFRSGTPVLTATWRHQVVFEPSPSGHFFVHFECTISSTDNFTMDGQEVRIGEVGKQFRINLVGDPDPAGKVNGKFAGYAVGLRSKS